MDLAATRRRLATMVAGFLRHCGGATAVEYGVIAMAMFLAIIPAFLYVSTGISVKFQGIVDYFATFS